MGRGFLKGGLTAKVAAGKDSTVSKTDTTDPTVVRTLPSECGVTMTALKGNELPFKAPTISSSGRIHPPPKRMYRMQMDETSLNKVYQQGVPVLDSPLEYPMETAEKEKGLAVLGFGASPDGSFFDTLCITSLENRLHLREHPGFDECLWEDLREQNSMWVKVVSMAGKGLALVANRNIPQGKSLVCERPLLSCPSEFPASIVLKLPDLLDSAMAPIHKQAYYALYNCKPKGKHMIEAFSILRTNGFGVTWPVGEEVQSTVFDWMSRANHSCVPNVRFTWNHNSFCGAFTSVRDIKKGEEITVSYTELLCPSEQRKATLQEKYLFTCECPACTLPPDEQHLSDHRRQALSDRFSPDPRIGQYSPHVIEHGYSDSYVEETLAMLAAEGLEGQNAEMLAQFAEFESRRANLGGDYSRAIEMAKRTVQELKKMGVPDDSGVLQRMEKVLKGKNNAEQVAKNSAMLNLTAEDLENLLSSEGRTSIPGWHKFLHDSPALKAHVMEKTKSMMETMVLKGHGLFVINERGEMELLGSDGMTDRQREERAVKKQ